MSGATLVVRGTTRCQSNPDAQPVRINDRIEFDGNDIMQISKDPFKESSGTCSGSGGEMEPELVLGNSLAGYDSMNAQAGGVFDSMIVLSN